MTPPPAPKVRRLALAAVAAVTVAVLSACQEVEADERIFKSESKVTEVEKGDPHKMVTLTQRGIDQIGLKTEAVTGTDDEKVIPYSALLYDSDGEHTYVYANPRARSYKREDVTVIRIVENHVLLSEGPPVGSKVVTQGVTQIHGAELEFGKY